jgi:hypothetical protein
VQLGPSHRVQHRQRLASEESLNQLTFASELDFRGLLIAATIIGAVDVLDDVTITQASAVWELHTATPGSGPAGSTPQASASVATTSRPLVNTLVLAYTAAALPTLLWFSSLAIGEVLTTERLAVEIVQTLVGSIGLVASVPLTTALAAWVVTVSGHEQPDRFDRPTRPTAERPQDMFTLIRSEEGSSWRQFPSGRTGRSRRPTALAIPRSCSSTASGCCRAAGPTGRTSSNVPATRR